MSEERAMVEILRRLDQQDRRYEERSRLDDQREERATRERETLIERVDSHGRRTTAMETKWEAFFGDQGAFRLFTAQVKELDAGQRGMDKKLDLLVAQGGTIPRAHVWSTLKWALTALIALLALMLSYLGYRTSQNPQHPISSTRAMAPADAVDATLK